MIVGKPLTVSEDENHVRITGEETEIIFDKKPKRASYTELAVV